MPANLIHKRIERALGLENYHWVSKVMDSNAPIFGPGHRMMFPHDPISGVILAIMQKDPKILQTHLVHNIVDTFTNPTHLLNMVESTFRTWAAWKEAQKEIKFPSLLKK